MINIVIFRHMGVDAIPQWGKICLTAAFTQL